MKANNQQGFSLLEILIAFSILAFSLGILLKIFSGGVNTAIVAEDYNIAVQIAESLMAEAGVESDLKPLQNQGVQLDKYAWSLTIEPFEFNPEFQDQSKLKVQLYKVSVSVVWGDEGENKRQINLKTLKLASKPL